MGEKRRLLIADDEPFICGMLEKLIDFETLPLTLIGCVNDGERLLSAIRDEQPDMVLTDISMPKMDGLEVIRRVKEAGLGTRFVVISGYRQFEYAYNALKYDVEDYLLKPVDQAELNKVLTKICAELADTGADPVGRQTRSQHAYLIEMAIDQEIRQKPMRLEELNRTWQVQFVAGCLYRVFLLKIDYARGAQSQLQDISSLIRKLRETATASFQPLCQELIFSEKQDGIMGLMAYERANEPAVLSEMEPLFHVMGNIAELFAGIQVSVCVGRAVGEVGSIYESKASCRRAEWLRMYYGTGKVILEESYPQEDGQNVLHRLDPIRVRLDKAVESMHAGEMTSALQDLFLLPPPVLCAKETMQYVRELIDRFASAMHEANGEFSYDELRARIFKDVHLCSTFLTYRDHLIHQMQEVMKETSAAIREKNVRPIRQACLYIEQNYGEHLSLESVAAKVNLSPVYFSNLFKKETGQNFTEYLTKCRMDIAKKLLKSSDQSVGEIADKLGYADARYFSKLFKKEVGVKPTEYRKIYG